jgi:hypothetical protein
MGIAKWRWWASGIALVVAIAGCFLMRDDYNSILRRELLERLSTGKVALQRQDFQEAYNKFYTVSMTKYPPEITPANYRLVERGRKLAEAVDQLRNLEEIKEGLTSWAWDEEAYQSLQETASRAIAAIEDDECRIIISERIAVIFRQVTALRILKRNTK